MAPQPDVSPQSEALLMKERLNFLRPHVESIFDWSETRRNKVVGQSKEKLKSFLGNNEVSELWDNIVQSFTNHTEPPTASRFIKVGGEVIAVFSPSDLPTHSEYHIAKVIILTTELFEKALPEKLQTEENKLALTLSAVIHDIGSLQHIGEEGPQEKFYRFHELRAIAMVDSIVDRLHLSGYEDQTAKEKLKQKIKLLIASTVPKWNLDYGKDPLREGETHFGRSVLSRLLNQKGENMTEDDFMTALELKEEEKDDLETRGIKLEQAKTAKELYALFKKQPSDEMAQLTEIMGAADHGAYLLEPARIAEIIGLWQELNRMWKNGQREFEHRPFGSSKNYLEYMLAGFPEYQWKAYHEILERIGRNPFMDLEVGEMKKYIDAIGKLLETTSDSDSLARFEGTFTPEDLGKLANKRRSKEVDDELLKYSEHFAHIFHNAHDFYALSTPVLRALYKTCDTDTKRTEFLREALQVMIKESSFELTSQGRFVLHIAPGAYCEETGETLDGFMRNLMAAYDGLPPEEQKRISQIYLTGRIDRGDDVYRIHQEVLNIKKEQFVGISIGGRVEVGEKNLGDLRHIMADVPLLVHFGMEENSQMMEQRLTSLLKELDPTDERFKFLSIHIDDHFDWFMDFYNKHSELQPVLKQLIKSVSPLGYLFTGGETAFTSLKEFFGAFPDVLIGSHNSCLLGSFGLSGQRLAKLLLTPD